MYATYLIPSHSVKSFLGKLDSLARKAKKLGIGSVIYTHCQTLSRLHPDHKRAKEGEVITLEAYTVTGEAPRLNGWEFVATLQHETTQDGKIINLIHSHTDHCLPVEYRTATPDDCDHCHTRRRRNDTFVVRHEDGTHKQVGRQCLKDFLGYNKSPNAIADFATSLAKFFEEAGSYGEESFGGGGGYEEIAFALDTFLARVAVCIDENGWVSRGKAREDDEAGNPGTIATADYVWSNLIAKTPKERKAWDLPTPIAATFDEVKESLVWLAKQDGTNSDYIYNCQTIVQLDHVTFKTAGYLASVLSSYRRANARQLYNEVVSAKGNDHVGTIGKREEFLLTLIAIFPVEGYYGTSYIHKFADRDGNAVTWFASNPEAVPCSIAHPHSVIKGVDGYGEGYRTDMVKGATYRVHATVKEHGDYKGQAQTKVTRITVKPIALKPKRRRKTKAKAKAKQGTLELV